MRWLPLLIVLLSMPAIAAERGDRIEGQAVALDGDTLMLDGHRIRLWGLDAPEMDVWPWGAWARGFLDDLLSGNKVSCKVVGRHRKREVAVCSLERIAEDATDDPDVDLAHVLISYGHGVTYRRFTLKAEGWLAKRAKAYAEAEDFARSRKLGLWRNYLDLGDPMR